MNSEEFYMRMIHMNVHPSLLKNIIVVHEETTSKRKELEYPSDIQATITDRDILLAQIDAALDDRDTERFMQLTDALKGMEVLI